MKLSPYTIVNSHTGEIIQTGSAPENQMDAMRTVLEEGQELIQRKACIRTQRVSKAGSIIRKSRKVLDAEDCEQTRRKMLRRRKELLDHSDWTQVPDAPVDQAAWRVYRQALRDLPANTPDPRNVTWPEAPE